MNFGKLNKRIEIQRLTEIEDKNGITSTKYQPLKKVWASCNNLFGKEYWSAKEYGEEKTTEFVIRFSACPDLCLTDRFLFSGELYNISFIDNIKYKSEILKIKATVRE